MPALPIHIEKRHARDGGFTLIEVLMVLVIFSVGILAVAAMQTTSVKGVSSARRVTEAIALAENQIERLIELPYDHDDLDPALNANHQFVQGPYALNWNVDNTDMDGDGNDDSKTVGVTVNWVYGKERNVNIVYIIPEL
jgi:type IV pilus assembly protein PilV